MKNPNRFFALFVFIFFLHSKLIYSEPPHQKIIDLSYSFDEQTIYWPTAESFKLDKRIDGFTDKGYYYSSYLFSTAEHGGTHLDAPKHFSKNGEAVNEIPLSQLIGNGVVIDVEKECKTDRDYQIQIKDFLNWEKENGKIPKQSIVLVRTGFGKFWPDRKKYLGTSERNSAALSKLHFPGLHPDATKWLIENRSIKAVGLDTSSTDHGQSTLFETHRILGENNIPSFENVANLDKLPSKNFKVIALPMKIKGGSGAPLRVVAIVNDSK